MMHAVWILGIVLLLAVHAFGGEPATESARLLAEGDKVFSARDYAKATEIYLRAVAAAERANEPVVLVEALSMAARGYLIREQVKEGRPFIDRAGKLADAKEPAAWSRYLGVRGRFEWKEGDKPRAARTFETMYAYCLKHEQYNRAVDAAHMVAIVGTHDQQLEWAKKGIAAAERGGMDGWLGPLWNNLGNTYLELKRYEDGLDALLKARKFHWKVGNEHSKLVADWAVGMAYQRLGELEKAKQWLRPVLAWAERRLAEKDAPDRREWVALAHAQLGLVARAEGRIDDARAHLDAACPVLEALKMPEWDPAGWKELADARKALTPPAATGK